MALRDFSEKAMKKFDKQLREANDVKTAKCPECEGDIDISPNDVMGDTIECDECGVELELTGPDDDPIGLELIEENDDDDDDQF